MKKLFKIGSILLCVLMTLTLASCEMLESVTSFLDPFFSGLIKEQPGNENEPSDEADKSYFEGKQSVLLMGQSNMAGRGDVNAVEPISNDMITMMNKNNQWVKMQEPIHYDKSVAGVGLAASFADAFVNTFDVDVGLVPCAMGGTSIAEWAVGGQYYNNTIARAKEAQKESEICAILWHQGCADQSKASGYAEKFKIIMDNLIDDLELDAEKIVIISGELGPFRTGSTTELHEQFVKIGDYYDNYAVTSSEGLTAQDKTTHFDAQSLRVFGYRYFANFYKLTTGKTYTDFSNDPNDYLKKKDDSFEDENCTNKTPEPPKGYVSVEEFTTYQNGYTYPKNGKVINEFNDANGKYVSVESSSSTPYVAVSAPVGTNKDFVIEADYRVSVDFKGGADIMKPVATGASTISLASLYLSDGKVYTNNKLTSELEGVTITNMEWTHFTVVYHLDTSVRDIYVDGKLVLQGDPIDSYSDLNVTSIRLIQIKKHVETGNCVYADNFKCYYGTEIK